MKLLLGVLLAGAFFIIAYYIYRTCREKHKLAWTVRMILCIGALIVLANFVSLFTTTEFFCTLAYTVYFVGTDWMLYYLLRFSLEYIGNDFEHHVRKKILLLVLLLDSVSLVLNNIYHHLFQLNPVRLFGGEGYFELETKPWFYLHYTMIILLVSFCLVALFYRSFTAPMFYRKKYLTIALVTTGIMLMNLISYQWAVDISVIGYAVEGVCIYYCVFVYTPQKLLPKTLFQVAQDMSVALFVLDTEGEQIYSNKCAAKLLDKEKLLVNAEGVTLEQWCRDKYVNYREEFVREETFYRDEEELILSIQLQRMMDSNHQLQGGYFTVQDRTEEINNLKKEQYLATHDSLTGLYNKDYFFEVARKCLRKHPDLEFLMICTDIKDFKMINDFLGTKIGDTVLLNVAKMLKEKITGGVACGRLGNDIFAVLMPKKNYNEAAFLDEASDALLSGMTKEISYPVVNYVGVYEIAEPTIPISVMCDRARMAISTIKGDYHKRIAYYDNELRDGILHEQELIRDLNEAIRQEQIRMYLQPQVAADGRLLGAEALVRWNHPRKGPISPGDFIPLFEKNGLISDVDLYIWENACKQLKRWKELGKADLYISVNISPRDFYFLNVYQIFTELVRKYGIEPQNIKLEITETAIVMDFKRQMDLITRLRRTGFVVEMDDFGSGYSSLNMLKDIHVDILKIDMAFLKKARDEERSKKILQMVIGLSRQLGMPVITEGVENAEQVAFLEEMGCNMFQGYYFARPMTTEEFEAEYF